MSGGNVAFNEVLDEGYRTYDIMGEGGGLKIAISSAL
jgi:hypothetical protein